MAVRWRRGPALGEAALDEGMKVAARILAAADARDALAAGRDAAADERDRDIDLAELLGRVGDYGSDWPARRAAALDREAAKRDRIAARDDLIALADQFVVRERPVHDDELGPVTR
jgi:hypothetical protein